MHSVPGTPTRAASRRAPSHPVTLVVEASGDLLIHSPVWEQALQDGGGNHYNFAPMFAQIKQIPSAHWLEIPLHQPCVLQPRSYWNLDLSRPLELSLPEAKRSEGIIRACYFAPWPSQL